MNAGERTKADHMLSDYLEGSQVVPAPALGQDMMGIWHQDVSKVAVARQVTVENSR